jgi:hypothetical protein
MISAEQWRKELAEGLSDSELGRLRLNTHTGRPLGSDSFLSKLEGLLGRRVLSLVFSYYPYECENCTPYVLFCE